MRNIFFTICVFALVLVSCAEDDNINPDGLGVFTVDVSGTWSIVSVWQNGNDITNVFDFSSLNLELIYSGGEPVSYSITGATGVPFALKSTEGELIFNDVKFPTELIFLGNQNVTFNAVDPIISKGGFMKLSVHLGCADNAYVYSLKKN